MSEAEKRERDWKRRRIYFRGKPLTFETYRAVVEFQGGKCAMCGAPESKKALVADHAHDHWARSEEDLTDNFRGAVCSDCNYHMKEYEGPYFGIIRGGLSMKPAPRSEQVAFQAKFPAQCAYFDNPPAKRWAAKGSPGLPHEAEGRTESSLGQR